MDQVTMELVNCCHVIRRLLVVVSGEILCRVTVG
jgi:hypothetical protein